LKKILEVPLENPRQLLTLSMGGNINNLRK